MHACSLCARVRTVLLHARLCTRVCVVVAVLPAPRCLLHTHARPHAPTRRRSRCVPCVVPETEPQPAAIKVPVQAHFGQLDTLQGFSDPASIQAVVEKMQGAGVPVELFMYAHSGHAFMNALTEAGRAKIKGELAVVAVSVCRARVCAHNDALIALHY